MTSIRAHGSTGRMVESLELRSRLLAVTVASLFPLLPCSSPGQELLLEDSMLFSPPLLLLRNSLRWAISSTTSSPSQLREWHDRPLGSRPNGLGLGPQDVNYPHVRSYSAALGFQPDLPWLLCSCWCDVFQACNLNGISSPYLKLQVRPVQLIPKHKLFATNHGFCAIYTKEVSGLFQLRTELLYGYFKPRRV